MNFLTVPEAPGLFVDALLTDLDDQLLFISVWGRDTAVQALLARLSLPSAQDGFVGGGFHYAANSGTPRPVAVDSADRFTHTSGRAPHHNLFGEGLTHAWVYDSLAEAPDRANQRALLLTSKEAGVAASERAVWRLLQDTCSVPLLPHWDKAVLRTFSAQGWIQGLSGHNLLGYYIRPEPTEVEGCIRTLVRAGKLRESADAPSSDTPHQCREPAAPEWPVISQYTRADALDDGVLVDVSETAREAGLCFPVALTHAVYEDCVVWSECDQAKCHQDPEGRLWDILWMLRDGIRRAGAKDQQVVFEVRRVPRSGRGRRPRRVQLRSVVGPGDAGEPVITVMQLDES